MTLGQLDKNKHGEEKEIPGFASNNEMKGELFSRAGVKVAQKDSIGIQVNLDLLERKLREESVVIRHPDESEISVTGGISGESSVQRVEEGEGIQPPQTAGTGEIGEPGELPPESTDMLKPGTGRCSTELTTLSHRLNMSAALTAEVQSWEKTPFMQAESDLWISNRLRDLQIPDVERRLRKAKNWESKLLVENQERVLKRAFILPKLLFKIAWVCYLLWMIFIIFVIFIFGVSIGNDETAYPTDELLEAATSSCDEREIASGDTVAVDVDASDALNLQGAQNIAGDTNENFERYGDGLSWLKFDILPEDVEESYRFFASSLSLWIVGTVVVPMPMSLIFAFLLALTYTKENSRLKKLFLQGEQFHLANISDLETDDHLFFICCWPEALVDILKSDTPDDERIKLHIRAHGTLEKVLQMAWKIF